MEEAMNEILNKMTNKVLKKMSKDPLNDKIVSKECDKKVFMNYSTVTNLFVSVIIILCLLECNE